MRVVVTGTSGAGKTTLARKISATLGAPHIELDAINWQAGWHDLSHRDPDEFVRRVAAAIAGEAWVVDGNYGPVRDMVWKRATHLVWLDYERAVVMARVIRRTFLRAALRIELWNATASGCVCSDRAIRYGGPGTPGPSAAMRPRRGLIGRNMLA